MRNLAISILILGVAAAISLIPNIRPTVSGIEGFTEAEQVSIVAYIELLKSEPDNSLQPRTMWDEVAAYIKPIRPRFLESTLVCLGTNGERLFALDNPPELAGPPATGNIVSSLREYGYDTISASDCVYRVDGPEKLWISSRSISRPALLISITSAEKLPGDGAYSVSGFSSYGMTGGCISWSFQIARADNGYEVVPNSRACSTWS